MLAGICKWDDFSSVYYECFSYNNGDGDNDGGNNGGTGTGTNDDYGWRCDVDDDGSVCADVQGCFLLGLWIFRDVLWLQAGQHGGYGASFAICRYVLSLVLRHQCCLSIGGHCVLGR